jgi:hypothetical protein
MAGFFLKKRKKRISNTRLPKLYLTNAAYLLLLYNTQHIEHLSPIGMSGQVEQGISNYEV